MEAIEVFFHPSCLSSKRLIMTLHREGLLTRVRFIDVSNVAGSGAMRFEVWSVPWLVYDGRAAAMDPIKPEEMLGIIERGEADVPRHVETAFVRAVLHSSYASACVYLHGSLEPVLSESLASAAVRHPFGGPSPGEVLERVRRAGPDLLEDLMERSLITLGAAYLRAVFWTGDSDARPPDEGEVARWLLASVSIGRVGLPRRPIPDPGRVRRLAQHIRDDFSSLLERVSKEQEEVLGDEEYWSVLRGLG